MTLPDATVAFISHSKDVWWELPKMVLGVQIHPLYVIQPWDLLVGVHSCQNAANISLKKGKEVASGSGSKSHFVSAKI